MQLDLPCVVVFVGNSRWKQNSSRRRNNHENKLSLCHQSLKPCLIKSAKISHRKICKLQTTINHIFQWTIISFSLNTSGTYPVLIFVGFLMNSNTYPMVPIFTAGIATNHRAPIIWFVTLGAYPNFVTLCIDKMPNWFSHHWSWNFLNWYMQIVIYI